MERGGALHLSFESDLQYLVKPLETRVNTVAASATGARQRTRL